MPLPLVRRSSGVPVASDFAGAEPPLVVDGSTGAVYSITNAGLVVKIGAGTQRYYPAGALTKAAGGAETGTVANVQTMLDGSVYDLAEAATTPGFSIVFDWTGVTEQITGVVYRCHYDGLSTHVVTFDLWNYLTSAYVQVSHIESADEHEAEVIPVPVFTAFVSGGAVKGRIIHNSAGNASHDIHVDYVGLVSA